jgi:pimeloyl-ACP methyl ester carboxylesterase
VTRELPFIDFTDDNDRSARLLPLRARGGDDVAVEHFANDSLSFDVTDTPAAGDGSAETVILLHGYPQDRHSWDAVARRLAEAGYRVLAPDQRGYSPAGRPTARAAYTIPRIASDVLALAEAADAKCFHLVGHDWGAAIAWYVAGTHPGRLLSLAALSVPHPQAFYRALATSRQAAMSWYMAAFQVPWLPERLMSLRGGAAMREVLVRTGLDAVSADRYARRAASPAALRGPLNWYRALPLEARVRTPLIEVPTLFLWGDREHFISRAAAELCGRYVVGSYRFEVLEGASHWLPEEEPAKVSILLAEHFAHASGGSRP